MSDTPQRELRYTIGELADQAGVSRRTVRYYVQRELLPAPDGLGRGASYTDAHLARLVRIRELQEAGIPLADIGRTLDDGVPAAPPSGQPVPPLRPGDAPARPAAAAGPPARWSRAVIADGVELHVRDGVLGEDALAALIHLVSHHTARVAASTREDSDDQ